MRARPLLIKVSSSQRQTLWARPSAALPFLRKFCPERPPRASRCTTPGPSQATVPEAPSCLRPKAADEEAAGTRRRSRRGLDKSSLHSVHHSAS
ncbi:hypothetical protein NDU88_006475 [Pleurodeles waltl]|uniref:Uncharacterized protein n=1 Tax=Pleurodeles waltl TaxID=8319 RepID=A0AAV7SPV5_PLEWA|nr:hypothetical protein NDU88_006475 [Pleurodeles waltl]